MFEHETKFSGDNVCSGIMKCGGDTRISEVEGRLLGLSKRHPHLWNYEYLDKLFSGVAGWAGFSQRIMEEANVAPKEASFDLDNYVIYPVNEKGFGVGRVDLGGALHEGKAEKILEDKKEFDKREFAFTLSIFVDAQIAIDFKIPVRDMRKARYNGKRINLKYCDDNEHREENEKAITLHIRKDRFAWVDSIKNIYTKYSEGTDMPEPIGKEIISPLFC